MAHRYIDRPNGHHAPPGYPPPFSQPPTAQPPVQIPFSDPFHTNRDPFFPSSQGRRDSLGRGWHPAQQGNGPPPPSLPAQPQLHHHPSHHASPIIHPQAQHPPPNGLAHMHPFDPSRRRSLGSAGSPSQYVGGPLEPPPPPPPTYLPRNMPPPSPPQMPPPPGSSHLSNAPRGPPTSSPFAGVRDLPGFAPHRPGAGMTISSILGGGEERKGMGSPHMTASGGIGTPKTMPPPSPGRVRASSMRESLPRREQSPPRSSIFGEPRAQSAFHERPGPEPRREVFASPRFQGESPHSFRAFRLEEQGPPPINGSAVLGRPSSQPIEHVAPRSVDEILARRDAPAEGRFGAFRHFAEPPRSERIPRHDALPFQNGITSQPRERHDIFGSPRMDRDPRPITGQFQPPMFGTPMREDQAGLFRPVFQQAPDAAHESIESRPLHDMRRDDPHYSPNMADVPIYLRGRNGFIDRPMTFEEHQRMEAAMQRDDSRKGSDSSGPRSLLSGISPELNRKGRNSPLPQAVQGVQPRFIGPGGDNPGIKMEFGRMFSGLGSGVGSATPVAGQSANGNMTPSRISPSRQFEDGDIPRSVSNLDDVKSSTKAKASRKNGRRAREEERIDGEGRLTPDTQRSNKRSKTNSSAHHHHHHLHGHHHHHHHHEPEPQAGSFNMLRFPPNPTPSASTNGSAQHHHHHHHATHHHHHHAPKSAALPRKPTTSVQSKDVLDAVASKPRKHLGSQLYTTELTQPANADIAMDSKLKYSSTMKAIPDFEGKENCTFTVRVPRFYLATKSNKSGQGGESSPLEKICKHRQLWGSDIYTDDSDVVAAAAHSGWIAGDFGESNTDLHDLVDEPEPMDLDLSQPSPSLTAKPARPVKAPSSHDLHITVLILPPLQSYASTMQHHVRSRAWDKSHDGMSYMIHRIDFVDEAPATRSVERGITARKQRITVEETRRREAAAGLLMFATGAAAAGAAVSVSA